MTLTCYSQIVSWGRGATAFLKTTHFYFSSQSYQTSEGQTHDIEKGHFIVVEMSSSFFQYICIENLLVGVCQKVYQKWNWKRCTSLKHNHEQRVFKKFTENTYYEQTSSHILNQDKLIFIPFSASFVKHSHIWLEAVLVPCFFIVKIKPNNIVIWHTGLSPMPMIAWAQGTYWRHFWTRTSILEGN